MEMIPYSNMEVIQASDVVRKPNIEDLCYRFLEYTDVKDTTIKGYAVCIRSFIRWMNETGVRTPDRADIMNYKAFLSDQSYSAGTQRQYLRAVKHLFKWIAAEGWGVNIAENIKGAKVKQDNTRKDPFSEDEIITIVNSIDTTKEAGKRDRAMILLAVTCGLRIIELQRADIGDIALKNGERVIYIQGKGHDEKDDYKKIVPEVWDAIADYLKTRPEAGKKDPLFASTSNRSKGKRIDEPTVSAMIKNIIRKAGFDSSRLTAHSFRHTSITMFLKCGATLQEAQAHARHADPKTTTIYAHNIQKDEQHAEQIIYDHIFKSENKNTKEKLFAIISNMCEKDAEKLLQYLQN